MAQVSGSLITRNYANFRGVDFSDNEVSITRSPDSLNMWKDYKKLGKCIETRPEIELVATYDNTIFGLFFYRVGNTEMMIVHSGTKLYKVVGETKTELFTGMKPAKSNAFVYNQILYIKDGINYLKYDGQTINQVVGYIPTTSAGRKPNFSGGSVFEAVNMLSAWRKNTFLADGEGTEYFLDAKEIDGEAPIVLVNGNQLTALVDFDYDTTQGKITFKVAPPKPKTDGQDNVVITYKKTLSGYADRINKCTLLQVFDDRVFVSGNKDYPNVVWNCHINDPTYFRDYDYSNEGMDLSPVKSMVAGNNALWVFKEPSQANTTVFYHTPSPQYENDVLIHKYPSIYSSISTGCVGAGINFNDDIVFFSDRGMEGLASTDIMTEQILAHRSSLIDSKLLSEANYKDMVLEEWEGYLLVIIDNKAYLADSRAMFTLENHNEYEWFYWELPENITCTKVKDGVLYLGTAKGIYTLTNTSDTREVNSYWTTPEDEFNYPHYQKTTNKRGCVIDMEGDEITVSTKIDNNEFETIDTYTNVKGYVVSRIKKKKWKSIQLKFSSNKPFGLYSNTLEAYVGGYVKR